MRYYEGASNRRADKRPCPFRPIAQRRFYADKAILVKSRLGKYFWALPRHVCCSSTHRYQAGSTGGAYSEDELAEARGWLPSSSTLAP